MRPGGSVKLSLPRFWSPSSRFSFKAKLEKAPAVALAVPASRVGLKGRIWPGHSLPVGTFVEAEGLGGFLFGQARVPGVELGT